MIRSSVGYTISALMWVGCAMVSLFPGSWVVLVVFQWFTPSNMVMAGSPSCEVFLKGTSCSGYSQQCLGDSTPSTPASLVIQQWVNQQNAIGGMNMPFARISLCIQNGSDLLGSDCVRFAKFACVYPARGDKGVSRTPICLHPWMPLVSKALSESNESIR